VIELVGEDDAVRQQPAQRRDRGLVGNEAGGEHQRRFLAVQVGERALELDQRPVGAGDVAGTAGADAEPSGGLLHGGDDLLILAHAQIVVRAPDGNLTRIVGLVAVDGAGELAGDALQIGKHPVASLLPESVDGVFENSAIIHQPCSHLPATPRWRRCRDGVEK
jgi:hypothetical protein